MAARGTDLATTEEIEALNGELDPFRETGDVHLRLPLMALKPFPRNPKRPIFGRYRKGLEGSLKSLAIRAELSVWADPQNPGSYFALDGNQRLSVLIDLAERKRGIKAIAEDDPHYEAKVQAIRTAALSETVECRVLADLDADDAEDFNAILGRNSAVHDEGMIADLAERIERRPPKRGENARKKALVLESLRADVAFVSPSFTPSSATTLAPSAPAPAEFTPTDEEPWGAPPAISEESRPGAEPGSPPEPKPALISFVLSVTPDSFHKLNGGSFASRSRGLREERAIRYAQNLTAELKEALRLIQSGEDLEPFSQDFLELAAVIDHDRIRALRPRD